MLAIESKSAPMCVVITFNPGEPPVSSYEETCPFSGFVRSAGISPDFGPSP